MFLAGNQVLQSHDPKLVLLAAAICTLGSFITIFLFAQAREMHGQGRGGWLFLSGFAAGAVMWTTHFVALLAFQPDISVAFDPGLTGGAFFVGVLLATTGMAIAAYGSSNAAGLIGGAVVGLAAVALHFTAMASLHVAGAIVWNPTLVAMGAVLCVTATTLAISRCRREGRNVQVIAPLLLAAGIAIMHFVGMAAISITPSTTIPIPPKTIDPTVLGYFVAAMVLLLMGTGVATTLIARGARKEAQTQLRNIADASVEGLILTDGTTILDFNESVRALVGGERAAEMRGTQIWEVLDYTGDRTLERFEAQLRADGGPVPVEVIARKTEAEGAVRKIFAIRDLRERRAAEQRILYLAHFDTLTGLPNRASFQDRLENDIASMNERDGELALMIVDLDRFKEINDVHGHAAGDELLKATAARIVALLSHNEFAARLGGDEFVIVQIGPRAAGLRLPPRRQAAGGVLQAHAFGRPALPCGPDDRRLHLPARRRRHAHAARQCGPGALPRQGARPRPRLLLHARHGRDRPPAPRPRPAAHPGDRARRAGGPLPGAGFHRDRRDHRLRGARPLEPSHARLYRAVGVHPHRRGDGPHPASR